jgi:small subunit ribosomal protein S6
MTFIVRPDLDEEQTRAAVDSVTGRITAQGGELIATYTWNPPRRRLAYPIKDFGDGFYVTTVFRFPADSLKEFERGLRLNTGVLRFLIVQATDLNISQGQQRAQQAAARAAAPPAQPGAPAAVAERGGTAAEQAAPAIETVAPTAEPESQPEPVSVETESETQEQPEPVASAPAAEEE